jgi:hypothetical protein
MKVTGRRKCLSVARLVMVSAMLGLPATMDSTPAGSAAYYKMKQVQVIDPAGLGRPTPAAALMIPTDWQFKSDVRWANRGCFTDLAAVTFRAQSPDDRLVIEAFPSFSWQFVSDPAVQRFLTMENRDGAKYGLKPCPVVPPVPAADVLRKKVLPEVRPGKEIVSIDPVPDLDQFMKDRGRSVEEQSARAGHPVRFRTDSARARLKYDLDGQPVEEWVMAVSVAQASAISTGSATVQGVDCRAIMLFAMRAPQGQLEANETLFRMIRTSLKWEPQWQRQYLDAVTQLSNAQQMQRKRRADLWRQFQQNEINTIQSVMANQQAGANQAMLGADQITRGVETYRNPATGATYELSNLYGHAWMNGNNEYILSDDPNFNPQGALSGSWTSLEHVRPNP